MTCRTCKHLDVALSRNGRRVPLTGRVYPCEAPVEIPTLPASVTKSYAWRWPVEKQMMSPEDGVGCPSHLRIRSK
jgi:hypothetical protein